MSWNQFFRFQSFWFLPRKFYIHTNLWQEVLHKVGIHIGVWETGLLPVLCVSTNVSIMPLTWNSLIYCTFSVYNLHMQINRSLLCASVNTWYPFHDVTIARTHARIDFRRNIPRKTSYIGKRISFLHRNFL